MVKGRDGTQSKVHEKCAGMADKGDIVVLELSGCIIHVEAICLCVGHMKFKKFESECSCMYVS